jgi:hypothetical protein
LPEVETLRCRQDLVGKPHDYVREVHGEMRGLVPGDLVRSRRRRPPGRTVYWLSSISGNGENCVAKIVSLPAGGPDDTGRYVPMLISRIELVVLAQTPSWLIRRARNVPSGLMAWAESGSANLKLGEKPAPENTGDPIDNMDRLSLRQACQETLDRPTTVAMSPTEMRDHLRMREYRPEVGMTRLQSSRRVVTSAREEARTRASGTVHPAVLELLPTEDLLILTRGGVLTGVLRTIRELSDRLTSSEDMLVETSRQAQHAVRQLELRTQELATTERDHESSEARCNDLRMEKAQAAAQMKALQNEVAQSGRGQIPSTPENAEALRVGKEVLRQRKSAARAGGGRFGMIKKTLS